MELFIDKLDHELFTAYNVDSDMDKVGVLWNKIKNYPIVIKNACELKKEENVFNAPMMVYLALKYPGTVSPELFESIRKNVFSSEEVANTILSSKDLVSDSYLSLLLQNKDIAFTYNEKAFIKNVLLEQSSYKNPVYKSVNYNLFESQGKQDVNFCIDDLYIKMSEEELAFMAKGKSKTVIREDKRPIYDSRYWMFGNPNFSADEKKFLAHYMYSNPYEFEQVINTILYDIIKRYNIDINPYKLLTLSDQELDNLGIFNEVSYVKDMMNTRKEPNQEEIFDAPVTRTRA